MVSNTRNPKGKLFYNIAALFTFFSNVPSHFFLQLRGPATALSRISLHDLTTARHFKIFVFVICVIRVFTMKIENFQLRGNNSVCAGAFHLLRGRAPAQLRGDIVFFTNVLHFASI
jgi:hypothetical protein